MTNAHRWREKGFASYQQAKDAFTGMLNGFIQQGYPRGQLLPPECNEYLGWLLAGHPRWPEWAQKYPRVHGYAYDLFPISSATHRYEVPGFVFVIDSTAIPGAYALVWFSGFEALHGRLRTPIERALVACERDLNLYLSGRLRRIHMPIQSEADLRHLERLFADFCAEQLLGPSAWADDNVFAQAYPHFIRDRDLAELWRDYLDKNSMWGRRKEETAVAP